MFAGVDCTGLVQQGAQFAGFGESEGRWSIGLGSGGWNVAVEHGLRGDKKRIRIGVTPDGEGEFAAGFQNAKHVCYGFKRRGDEHDAEAADQGVESIRLVGQPVGVGNFEFRGGKAEGIGCAVGGGHHFGNGIDAADFTRGSDELGDGEGGLAATRRDIEDVPAGSDGGFFDEGPGDGCKELANGVAVFLPIERGVAPVDGFALLCLHCWNYSGWRGNAGECPGWRQR